MVKSKTHQVVTGRPSHMASWPWSLASTDFQLGIALYHLLESATINPTHERLQGRAGRLGGLAGWPTPGPTGQWHLHTSSSCQVHPRGDNYFG
jgi:hypothetical protein